MNEPGRPTFSSDVAGNGEVWTGEGTATRHLFPSLRDLKKDNYPSENMCSLALLISYGKFRYYTGGDMTGDTVYGRFPWRDIETPAARAAGPVDVAVASHHGYCDATGAGFVSALQPRAFVVNALGFSPSHDEPVAQHAEPADLSGRARCLHHRHQAGEQSFGPYSSRA